MAHTTAGGISFLQNNPRSFIPHGQQVFQRSILGDIADIAIGIVAGGECPIGQLDIPGVGCVDLGIGGNGGGAQPITSTTCAVGFELDVFGQCVPISGTDVTPGGDTPVERFGGLADGPALPSRVPRNVHVCPKFLDGSMGILYFSPVGGQLVCLPRSMSPKAAMAFGLIRKNKPRAKALVTAADGRLLSKIGSIQGKIGTLAAKADALGCPPKKKR